MDTNSPRDLILLIIFLLVNSSPLPDGSTSAYLVSYQFDGFSSEAKTHLKNPMVLKYVSKRIIKTKLILCID